ncbi:MAG: hypothetical protein HKN72_16645 [Gemmatimonadetes bacterium]|nr:hypothetical protein [Gemmatimonadota bacterium]NNF14858.1 hypothetical protein [Gemmatimonadota bacterium]
MKRSTLITVGIVVAVLGVAGLVFGQIPYDRDSATVELGSVELSAGVQEEADIPPILAGAVLVAGLGLIGVGATRS